MCALIVIFFLVIWTEGFLALYVPQVLSCFVFFVFASKLKEGFRSKKKWKDFSLEREKILCLLAGESGRES